MSRLLAILAMTSMTAVCACDRSADEEHAPPAASMRPAVEPKRVAAGDHDLRVLLAELAASKACEMIRGQYRGLRDTERPDTVIGIVWLRGCRITNRGSHITFHLSGNGWRWSDVTKQPVGATFHLHQYVRFAMKMEVSGPLDVAYDTGTHVVSFWFTPKGQPKVAFDTVGDVHMDEEGVWSSVAGALSGAVARSPDERAADESKKHGTDAFREQFADGLAVTIDLCKGLSRFGLERPRKGKMVTPDVGETRRIEVELEPAGLMVFGPHVAKGGVTVHVHPHAGAVKMDLACQRDADAAAGAFVTTGRVPRFRSLASRIVRGGDATLKLHRTPGSCPVMIIAQPAPGSARPVRFDWERPASETARAAGGPAIDC